MAGSPGSGRWSSSAEPSSSRPATGSTPSRPSCPGGSRSSRSSSCSRWRCSPRPTPSAGTTAARSCCSSSSSVGSPGPRPGRLLRLARCRRGEAQQGAHPRGVRRRVPLPVHPGRLGREHVDRHAGHHLRGDRPRPQHRRRPRRPPRPRVRRLPRRRRLRRGDPVDVGVRDHQLEAAVLVVVVVGALFSAFFGVVIGAPTLRLSRRLPRHRDPRLRRDLPHRHRQPRRHHRTRPHQRPERHPGHPRPHARVVRLRPAARRPRDHPRPVRELLLPPARGHGDHRLVFTRLNNTRIGRAWIAIREDENAADRHGHQRLPPQAPRLRPRRLPRRPRRDGQGPPDVLGHSRPVRLPRLGVPPRRGRPRRHGHRRRPPRRRDAPLPAPREAAVRQRLPAPRLRPRSSCS